jgi:hypothetical protein
MPEEISSHAEAPAGEAPSWPDGDAAAPDADPEVGPRDDILPGDLSGRRRRRQTTTFLVIVTVVLSIGLVGLTYYYGLWGGATDGGAATCAAPSATAVPHNVVSMNVFNGSDRRGLAGSVAKQLKKRKFGVDEVANDPLQQSVKGIALVRHGAEGALAARTVAAQLKGSVRLDPDERTNDTVDLVLGQKYAGLRTSKEAAKQLAASAPKPSDGCAT